MPDSSASPSAVPAAPIVHTRPLGMWQTNCFVVEVPNGPDPKGCWIVDCGQRPQPLFALIRERGLTPRGILLTHCHLDHIMGIDEALNAFGTMPILCHPLEGAWNGEPLLNLSAMSPSGVGEVRVSPPTAFVEDGHSVELCGSSWRVLHLPGHSPGSVAFWHEPSGQAIAGDVLFAGSIGRHDFPTSDARALKASLVKLMTLPNETRIYPGHGPATTIGRERQQNPYVLRPSGW